MGTGCPFQVPISSLRVIYKMERVCVWCFEMASKLGEVIAGFCCHIIIQTIKQPKR